ncbi:Stk1 family PASTA domain-containing Ser/Thr kinase [Isoptericola sp. BMS4]|uniref:Stk1 family PASTA domain-containing Ser/Thr kinase n=1 Tax=Isoptericola sp. BMS4 TaxID=2527875 RepID=UPI001424A293|nr:Stk1 family PASTA domain-containing Ser/Thr kinase [Isoptericola sp. BMS4]
MVDNTPRVLAGRYEVGELIGRGGMAEVHIGHDSRLGRTVAIKVLRSDLARDPSFLARFRREAQSAAALNHPAIVAVYDTGEDTVTDTQGATVHVPFIVMEYVEGHTVRDILQDGAAVPIEEALEITAGVLSALEYSHQAGIVHRDIKPANVMITPTGAVKVMDFGIARAVADSAATMTQTHAVIGTAQYLSPEQARGEQVDARSDLYSTGCLLFELLTGRPPFIGDSPVAVAYQHVGQAAQRPSELASDVPEVLDRIVLKSLAKDRDTRYSTAAEFRADLESALRGGAVTAPLLGAAAAGAGATQVMGAGAGTQVMDPATQQWGATGAPTTPPDGTPTEEEGKSRKGLMWTLITIGVLAVAAIVTILLLNGNRGPEQVEVPPLPATVTSQEARDRIEGAGLVYAEEIDTESTEQEGTFLGQNPQGGAMVDEGSRVTVTFAAGPDTIAVPPLAGLSESEAEDALAEANLQKGEVSQQNSASVAEGDVIESNPGEGQAVTEGDSVDLVLSTGQVSLPDLRGMSEDAAKSKLSDLGLSSDTREEESDEEPGTVISQSPAEGSVTQGDTVELVIAKEKAPEMTTVPEVVGQTLEDAQNAMGNANLEADPTFENSADVPTGTVISQEQPPGTELEEGSHVGIVVSSGPEAGEEPSTDPTDGETPGSGDGGVGDLFGGDDS